MYPNEMILDFDEQTTVQIGDVFDVAGRLTASVGLESDGGTGEPQLIFEIKDHLFSITMTDRDMATLADALAFYATAHKRIESSLSS